MLEVQKIAIMKAIRTLEAAKDNIDFAVEFDGHKYGNRELAAIKLRRRASIYPRGMTREYYAPYFKGAKIGDVIEIPFGNFDPITLSSNIAAACVHSFGKGNATTFRNMNTKCVEVFIMDIDDSIDHKHRIDLRGSFALVGDDGQ